MAVKNPQITQIQSRGQEQRAGAGTRQACACIVRLPLILLNLCNLRNLWILNKNLFSCPVDFEMHRSTYS